MAKEDVKRLISQLEDYKEYYDTLKKRKEDWTKKVGEKIDEIISPRVLVFPVQFENIFEIELDDIKIKEFMDIDDFEDWILKKAKNGRYLLVHNIYREFLLYIKNSEGIFVFNLKDIPKPEKIIKIQK